jgi:hypothetical protein
LHPEWASNFAIITGIGIVATSALSLKGVAQSYVAIMAAFFAALTLAGPFVYRLLRLQIDRKSTLIIGNAWVYYISFLVTVFGGAGSYVLIADLVDQNTSIKDFISIDFAIVKVFVFIFGITAISFAILAARNVVLIAVDKYNDKKPQERSSSDSNGSEQSIDGIKNH